ncbi:hypothetical protein FQA39_LY11066 [Lamprigera yunnana]|nr:hypothetical protein FQA39_LY11066 [Lamprigera yunnana]
MATGDERFLVSGWDDDLQDYDVEQNPHATTRKEILWAAEKGNLDVVKKLVELDPSLMSVVDSDGYSPLHRACYNNNLDIVLYLLEHGADVSVKTLVQWQPLHSACQWNNHACVSYLLQYGADVNALTEGGQTPLHIAASNSRSHQTVQLLLMHPYIQPNIKNKVNETAYDIAKRSFKYYNMFDMVIPGSNNIS